MGTTQTFINRIDITVGWSALFFIIILAKNTATLPDYGIGFYLALLLALWGLSVLVATYFIVHSVTPSVRRFPFAERFALGTVPAMIPILFFVMIFPVFRIASQETLEIITVFHIGLILCIIMVRSHIR